MPAERYFCSRRLRFLPVRDIGRSESLLARGRHSRTVPRRCRNLVWQCHHSERSSNPFSLFPIRLGGRTVASWKLQCCSGCLINRCTVIAQSQDLASVVKKKKKHHHQSWDAFLSANRIVRCKTKENNYNNKEVEKKRKRKENCFKVYAILQTRPSAREMRGVQLYRILDPATWVWILEASPTNKILHRERERERDVYIYICYRR